MNVPLHLSLQALKPLTEVFPLVFRTSFLHSLVRNHLICGNFWLNADFADTLHGQANSNFSSLGAVFIFFLHVIVQLVDMHWGCLHAADGRATTSFVKWTKPQEGDLFKEIYYISVCCY